MELCVSQLGREVYRPMDEEDYAFKNCADEKRGQNHS